MTYAQNNVERLGARSAVASRRTAPDVDRGGFTITELLVVVAIIAVILGLVFVAFPKITGAARSSRCQANQRAIALAGMSYATDNKTRLVSPRTDANVDTGLGYQTFPQAGSYKHYWVEAFNTGAIPGHNGNLITVDGKRRETDAALRNGALWDYTGNVEIYRSPFDPTPRLRSYSINAFVGVKLHDDSNSGQMGSIPAQYKHDTTTLSRVPQPARTFYTIAEWDRRDISVNDDFNFNGFMVHPDPSSQYWFDIPATWHEDVTISYVDGSTGSIQLKNKVLMDADPDGHDFVESGGALDFHEFRKMLLPGLIN